LRAGNPLFSFAMTYRLFFAFAAFFSGWISLAVAQAPLSDEEVDDQVAGTRLEDPTPIPPPGGEIPPDRPVLVYIIPVRDQIGQALMFTFRRGMKEAIELGADVVLLDMDTPGGRLDVTLEMMEMLDRFEGRTMTYVNSEAISAGAFISAATNEIFFAPRGVIGAAAPVAGTGQEIPESMKLKIMSYLRARIRAFTEEVPFRAEVITAMADSAYVLEINGEVIKGEGELLTLTATEAMKEYGDPPQPLLGAGIFNSIEDLLAAKYGENYTRAEFVPTWSEDLARLLTAISPLLLGVGLLCIFFEVKTPGFGVIGLAGLVMVSLVFFGHHLAGLSGMEPLLLFLLGLMLVVAEVLFFPGLIFPAVTGIVLMLGALVWGMADVWPGEGIQFSPAVLTRPLMNLSLGLIIAFIGAILLARLMPRSLLWDKMILTAGIGGTSQEPGAIGQTGTVSTRAQIGSQGTAVTDLYPTGEVEIDGRRYEARLQHGSAVRGDEVEVVGYVDFGLLVRRKSQ
jgi:membrane-bound serine protease (ClpP class)